MVSATYVSLNALSVAILLLFKLAQAERVALVNQNVLVGIVLAVLIFLAFLNRLQLRVDSLKCILLVVIG